MLIAVLAALCRPDFNTVDTFDPTEPDDITATSGGSPTTSQGGLSSAISVLPLVVMSLVLMAIMLVLGICCYRKLRRDRRPDDDDERIEELLLLPSDDF
jgi:hypothetical protein